MQGTLHPWLWFFQVQSSFFSPNEYNVFLHLRGQEAKNKQLEIYKYIYSQCSCLVSLEESFFSWGPQTFLFPGCCHDSLLHGQFVGVKEIQSTRSLAYERLSWGFSQAYCVRLILSAYEQIWLMNSSPGTEIVHKLGIHGTVTDQFWGSWPEPYPVGVGNGKHPRRLGHWTSRKNFNPWGQNWHFMDLRVTYNYLVCFAFCYIITNLSYN